MTKPRYDNHGTEFGTWIRKPKEIQSNIGFVATDLDYIWRNYKTRQFMFIEEKRYMSEMTFPQKRTFKMIHNMAVNNNKYLGFHLIQFEFTNPDDGDIYWNYKKITTDDLIQKLQFKNLDSAGLFGCRQKSLDDLLETTKP